RRRAPALRAVRRNDAWSVRGRLLLVPEDDRALAGRRAWKMAFLADLRRLQSHVPTPALARGVGHATTGLHLCRRHRLGTLESRFDDRGGDAGDRDARFRREYRAEPPPRRDRGRRSLGRLHARVGHDVAATAGEFRPPAGDPRTAAALGSQASRSTGRLVIAPASRRSGWLGDRILLGLAIFIGSESIFFLSIVAAYVAN